MKERGAPGALLFIGIGFWIVAYRLMPEPDWHPMSKLFVGFLGGVGTASVIVGVKDSAKRSGPWWAGLAGRLLGVATIWSMISLATAAFGTPHILFSTVQGQFDQGCIYLGWSGIRWVDTSESCAFVRWIARL